MTGRLKRTTYTTLVADALLRSDDFMTARQLMAVTGLGCCAVSAALHHLRGHKAVECMESEGQLWWYLTLQDDRSRVVNERTPESRPRRRKPKTGAA